VKRSELFKSVLSSDCEVHAFVGYNRLRIFLDKSMQFSVAKALNFLLELLVSLVHKTTLPLVKLEQSWFQLVLVRFCFNVRLREEFRCEWSLLWL